MNKFVIKNSFNKKRSGLSHGFTLVELLIVITIIALLSVAGLASFDGARQRAGLNIAGDKMVSVFKQQQLFAKSGKIQKVAGGLGQPDTQQVFCYGIQFNGKEVNIVKAPYVGFDVGTGSNQVAKPVDYCDKNSLTATPFNGGVAIKIDSLKYAGNAIGDNLTVFFRPPFANPQIFQENNLLSKGEDLDPVLEFTVKSASSSAAGYLIKFNLGTGLIEHVLSAS